jgi:hypothetical protein
MKVGTSTVICVPMFIALFQIDKWVVSAFLLSKDEVINKMWHMHTMEYYLTLERKEILTYVQHG